MPWYEKNRPTPFDNIPIDGLYFLDGDLHNRRFPSANVADKKLPRIGFPSGLSRSLSPGTDPTQRILVDVEAGLSVPYQAEPEAVLDLINENMLEQEHTARLLDQNVIAFRNDLGWGVKLTYHPEEHYLIDVEEFEWTFDLPAYDYLPDDIREKLPELYSQEDKGLDAEAVVKYFSPDSGWYWYASEYDGEDIFFGLVVGHEIELGYFAMSELRQVRGPLNLPIERDLYYQPKSLGELRDYHHKLRDE